MTEEMDSKSVTSEQIASLQALIWDKLIHCIESSPILKSEILGDPYSSKTPEMEGCEGGND